MNNFNNKNDDKTVILCYNINLPNNFLSDIFITNSDYKKSQDINLIQSFFLVKNYKWDDMLEKLSNLNLSDFINTQHLCHIKSIHKLNVIYSNLLLQLENTNPSIIKNTKNVYKCMSIHNYNLSILVFHNIKRKLE